MVINQGVVHSRPRRYGTVRNTTQALFGDHVHDGSVECVSPIAIRQSSCFAGHTTDFSGAKLRMNHP
ncbi:hypothetical protein ARTHROSP310_30470 [Arthrobacter sp. AD-310]